MWAKVGVLMTIKAENNENLEDNKRKKKKIKKEKAKINHEHS